MSAVLTAPSKGSATLPDGVEVQIKPGAVTICRHIWQYERVGDHIYMVGYKIIEQSEDGHLSLEFVHSERVREQTPRR